MCFVMLRRFIVMLFLLSLNTFAQPEGIGSFDIEKVRLAALGSDSGQPQNEIKETQQENISKVIIRITIYLAIIITLILFVAWLLRRNGMKAIRGGGGAMDIVETLPIGQNRMIIMVRVMDEIFLLSQTPSNISLIDKIGGQKAIDIIASSKGGSTMINFKDALNNFMGKIKKTV